MSAEDIPKQILTSRLDNTSLTGIIPSWNKLLDNLNLPSIHELLQNPSPKTSWKNSIKRLLNIEHYIALTQNCDNYPISDCSFQLGKPARHWSVTLNDRRTTNINNFRVRLLVGCDGLESDASRFRRRNTSSAPGDPSCKLCNAPVEDIAHFLHCPLLQPHRDSLLADMPNSVAQHIPDPVSEPNRFVNMITGTDWIQDSPTQVFIIDFLYNLRRRRNDLLTA